MLRRIRCHSLRAIKTQILSSFLAASSSIFYRLKLFPVSNGRRPGQDTTRLAIQWSASPPLPRLCTTRPVTQLQPRKVLVMVKWTKLFHQAALRYVHNDLAGRNCGNYLLVYVAYTTHTPHATWWWGKTDWQTKNRYHFSKTIKANHSNSKNKRHEIRRNK